MQQGGGPMPGGEGEKPRLSEKGVLLWPLFPIWKGILGHRDAVTVQYG